MRRINLDDKTKIQILKSTNILTVTALVISNVTGKIVLNEYEKLKVKHHFESRVLKRYFQLVPDEINKKIYDEFAFEWITSGLNVPDFPKEK